MSCGAVQQRDRPRRGARRPSAWRTSRLARTCPAMTFAAPGSTASVPPWRPGPACCAPSAPPRRSTRRRRPAHRGAGASGWCRRGWPCPESRLRARLWPAIASPRRAADRGSRAPVPARCGTPGSRAMSRRQRGRRDAGGVESEGADRRRRCAARRPSSRVAHQRAAADERHAEAHAFLFGEADHFDGERQAPAAERLHQRDAQHDAENAVEGAGVRARYRDASRCSSRGAFAAAAG